MRSFCKTTPVSPALSLLLPAGAAFARPRLLAAPQNVTVTAAYRQTTPAWCGVRLKTMETAPPPAESAANVPASA